VDRNVKGSVRTVIALSLLVALCACGRRNEAPMTECIGGKPAVERIKDVAPPNCLPEAVPQTAG
jgi:hypothetical protein